MNLPRKFLGILRRRLECLIFAGLIALLLPFFAVAVAIRAVRRQGFEPARTTLRRWFSLLVHGLRDWRNAWWVHFNLESPLSILRYMFLVEVFDLLNLASLDPVSNSSVPKERVLVIMPGHLGEIMLMVPMLRALRRQCPTARIDLMIGHWCEGVARQLPYQNETIAYSPHMEMLHRGNTKHCLGLVAEMRFLLRLRRVRYDLVISTSRTNITEILITRAISPDCWVGTRCDLDVYYHYGEFRADAIDNESYFADRVAGLLCLIGLQPDGGGLEFRVSDVDREAARQVLVERGVSADDVMIAVAPGAGWSGKMWPPDRFAALADRLAANIRAKILLLGAPGESYLGRAIQGLMGHDVIDLIGITSFVVSVAALERCRLLICNDSAMLHFAAALDVPSVSFFGPTRPQQFAPRNGPHVHIRKVDACAGCESWHPRARCVRDGYCMKLISVEEAEAAALELIQRVYGKELRAR